jgi:putative Holliday junction resolvase
MKGRVIAVDPGEKRIGVAISDPCGIIANPLSVIKHISRQVDTAAIIKLAEDHEAILIIIGQALDGEGMEGPAARHSKLLCEEVRRQTSIQVELWDESNSTQIARFARVSMGVSRRKRFSNLDELAAAVILQSFLDAHA